MTKKVKRVLALLLALTMVFSLAACGTTPPAASSPAASSESGFRLRLCGIQRCRFRVCDSRSCQA